MSLKLWYSPGSPFVRKVLVFAHEVGLADAIVLANGNVWAPDTPITKENPLGKVPVLARIVDQTPVVTTSFPLAWFDSM